MQSHQSIICLKDGQHLQDIVRMLAAMWLTFHTSVYLQELLSMLIYGILQSRQAGGQHIGCLSAMTISSLYVDVATPSCQFCAFASIRASRWLLHPCQQHSSTQSNCQWPLPACRCRDLSTPGCYVHQHQEHQQLSMLKVVGIFETAVVHTCVCVFCMAAPAGPRMASLLCWSG
jgi:hypothetical protein